MANRHDDGDDMNAIAFTRTRLTTSKRGAKDFHHEIEVPTMRQLQELHPSELKAYELRLKVLEINNNIRQTNLLESIHWDLFCLRPEKD